MDSHQMCYYDHYDQETLDTRDLYHRTTLIPSGDREALPSNNTHTIRRQRSSTIKQHSYHRDHLGSSTIEQHSYHPETEKAGWDEDRVCNLRISGIPRTATELQNCKSQTPLQQTPSQAHPQSLQRKHTSNTYNRWATPCTQWVTAGRGRASASLLVLPVHTPQWASPHQTFDTPCWVSLIFRAAQWASGLLFYSLAFLSHVMSSCSSSLSNRHRGKFMGINLFLLWRCPKAVGVVGAAHHWSFFFLKTLSRSSWRCTVESEEGHRSPTLELEVKLTYKPGY